MAEPRTPSRLDIKIMHHSVSVGTLVTIVAVSEEHCCCGVAVELNAVTALVADIAEPTAGSAAPFPTVTSVSTAVALDFRT
jgi:hypothetical protein